MKKGAYGKYRQIPLDTREPENRSIIILRQEMLM